MLDAGHEAAASERARQIIPEIVRTWTVHGEEMVGDSKHLRHVQKLESELERLEGKLSPNNVDAIMTAAGVELYPGCDPSTISRQLYTPVFTVLNLAAKGKNWKPALARPKGYAEHKPARSPREPSGSSPTQRWMALTHRYRADASD